MNGVPFAVERLDQALVVTCDRSRFISSLLLFVVVSVGVFPVHTYTSADGAIHPESPELLKRNEVHFDLDRCLPTTKTMPAKARRFAISGAPMNLTIAVSDRPYHMIASYMLLIVLRDYFNYDDVVLRPLDDSVDFFDQSEILAKMRSDPIGLPTDRVGAERRFPQTMINLEVWRDSGYGSSGLGEDVLYAGSLTMQGLFGWWIPNAWARLPENRRDFWDHYKLLTMPEKAKKLRIDAGTLDKIIPEEIGCSRLLNLTNSNPFSSKQWRCEGKILVSSACKSSPSTCGTLLAEDPHLQIGRGTLLQLLTGQIDGLTGALVNLAFLGREFDSYILSRLNASTRVPGTLFFSWKPNTLTACDPGDDGFAFESPHEANSQQRFHKSCVTRIVFPDCAEGNPRNFPLQENSACNFQENEIVKAVWSGLKRPYPEIVKLVEKMRFTGARIEAMFRRYAPQLRYYEENRKEVEKEAASQGFSLADIFGEIGDKYDDGGITKDQLQDVSKNSQKLSQLITLKQIAAYKVACEYLRRDRNWKYDWGLKQSPSLAQEKKLITFGGMYPIVSHWSQPGIKVGVDLAIAMINNDSDTLKEYVVEQVWRDTQCQAGPTIKAFIDFITWEGKNIVGIVGPGCTASAKSLGSVTKFFDYAFISYSAEGVELANDFRNNFLRTVPEANLHAYAFRDIYKKFRWRQAIFIAQTGDNAYEPYQKAARLEIKKDSEAPNPDRNLPEVFKISRKPVQAKGKWAVYEEISQKLDSIKNYKGMDFRIFSLHGDPDIVWRVLCLAYKKNMRWKNEYQWFISGWYWATDNEWWRLESPPRERQAGLYGQAVIEQLWEEQRGNDSIDDVEAREKFVCSDEDMVKALNGSLSIVNGFTDKPSAKIHVPQFVKNEEGKKVAMDVATWEKLYQQRLKEEFGKEWKQKESLYASYAYDATWVYAKALDHYVQENDLESIHTRPNTVKFMQLLRDVTFQGVSGPLSFKKNTTAPLVKSAVSLSRKKRRASEGGFEDDNASAAADRVGGWSDSSDREDTFVYLQQNDLYTGQNKKVAKYMKNKLITDFSVKDIAMGFAKICWPNGHPIKDMLEEIHCGVSPLDKWLGFDENSPNCPKTLAFLNVFGGIICVIVIVVVFFLFNKKLKRLKKNADRMNGLGILGNGHPCLQLDDWEIPRENIVINRKLGEGAFGTVYGGEAYFEEKGWQSVAIKTLKEGAQMEEKIDFLSEANMMKRFQHKNIVELLGVCTRCERRTDQVYTVMEFMLFGDLKTYLLSRRSLVGQVAGGTGGAAEGREIDDVSSRRLTSMALDIANGMAYLNQLDLVHRDLASRNCLLSAEKTVKIGDFGMARQMFDNDYYRFSKKGMLPVRWMAPESLADGLYTPQSDVWSYGIVLYEIITFGSFPYQGISNSQVVEYVKAGNKLVLSEAIPLELREMLGRCWEFQPDERPTITDIVEVLVENSMMISPCLEAPVASVPIEGAGSLELVSIPWAVDRGQGIGGGPGGGPVSGPGVAPNSVGQVLSNGHPEVGNHRKRSQAPKSTSSFSDHHQHQPRSPIARNLSHPSTVSTTTTATLPFEQNLPEGFGSVEPHLPKAHIGTREKFFARSNSDEASEANSPPPTPTAQLTSFFSSAAQALRGTRRSPSGNSLQQSNSDNFVASKANSLGFSSTPSPTASGLTTPMGLTPTKQNPLHYHNPLTQSHRHNVGCGVGVGEGAAPSDLGDGLHAEAMPLQPMRRKSSADHPIGGLIASPPRTGRSPPAALMNLYSDEPTSNKPQNSNGSLPFHETSLLNQPSLTSNNSASSHSVRPVLFPTSAPPAVTNPATLPLNTSPTLQPSRATGNDSAYGSGVGPTGLASNGVATVHGSFAGLADPREGGCKGSPFPSRRHEGDFGEKEDDDPHSDDGLHDPSRFYCLDEPEVGIEGSSEALRSRVQENNECYQPLLTKINLSPSDEDHHIVEATNQSPLLTDATTLI